jgi:hypothetical protein
MIIPGSNGGCALRVAELFLPPRPPRALSFLDYMSMQVSTHTHTHTMYQTRPMHCNEMYQSTPTLVVAVVFVAATGAEVNCFPVSTSTNALALGAIAVAAARSSLTRFFGRSATRFAVRL